jgi:hypothetical protein
MWFSGPHHSSRRTILRLPSRPTCLFLSQQRVDIEILHTIWREEERASTRNTGCPRCGLAQDIPVRDDENRKLITSTDADRPLLIGGGVELIHFGRGLRATGVVACCCPAGSGAAV